MLSRPDEAIRDVYFPVTTCLSVSAVSGSDAIEVALICNEGMLGIPLVLGLAISPVRTKVMVTGAAWRVQAGNFRALLSEHPELRHALDLYLAEFIQQVTASVACAFFHLIEGRLARRLLMAHDRAPSDSFHMTHATLAEILGVRRSGVSVAAGVLQSKKLIHYSRGGITVLDRSGLERAACACLA
ncbi:MAG: Crp/Fnr family transcriptional regulator [Gammaproteobacteria bacterium]